jgi:hypothetical protein
MRPEVSYISRVTSIDWQITSVDPVNLGNVAGTVLCSDLSDL